MTIDERIRRTDVKSPPGWLYRLLMQVTKLLNRGSNTHFTYRARPAEEPGSIVMIANHASRVDYQFTAPVCYPKKLNYVVGYNEFFRFPTSLLLPVMQVIPKKNFTPDTHAMRQILRVIHNGGNICLMPEGMSSITGMAQPVIPGGAKLIKKLGVPVYFSKISGGYLTYTKHCLDQRKGRIDVVVDRMFSAEQLREMSVEEIEDTMNRLLAHDDYMWNRKAHVRFDGKGQMAKHLDTLLYVCPKCGALYEMDCEGNTMRCRRCGNTVELDEYYQLRPVGDSVCPGLVTDWTIMERRRAAEEVRRPDFCHSGHVRVGVLPEHKPLTGDETSLIRGEGTLTLDHGGLHFDGVLEDATLRFTIASAQLPTYGMCTDISRFYTFLDGRFLEFYPDAGDVLLWDHLTEELHRYQGGKWQDTPYRHRED
ncbi:MAG: 1-acyl-sn-glycerol-3-phosphate acyltransferase [Oscillospiraceae bacterium]|nr:1-acyl-sn-glycerol-3-phosphate acyltransferase [Oscillospiraceae bacterium]